MISLLLVTACHLAAGEMNNEPVITTNLAKIPFPGKYHNQERFVDSELYHPAMIFHNLLTVGVAGMKLQLNSRTAAKEVQDTGVTPPRPVSAKVNIIYSSQINVTQHL